MAMVYHHVTISSLYVSEAMNLCENLRRRGVTFDTGYGPNGMDWELDWSIEGHMTAQDILLELEDLGIDYVVIMSPSRSEKNEAKEN